MQASNKIYNKHFFALSTLLVLGNMVITAPENGSDVYTIGAFLISVILSVALYFVCFFIPFVRVTKIATVFLAFFCVGDAFVTFINFISQNLLSETQRFLIVLPLIFLLVYVAFIKIEAVYKFSIFGFAFGVFVVSFFFLSTADEFEIGNIVPQYTKGWDNFFSQILHFFNNMALPTLVLSFFARFEGVKKSAGACGIVTGYFLLALCILNSGLLFGPELSARLNYPYSAVGSTVTFGNLFTRLDGFLYLFYIITVLVKCAVGIFVIKKSRE